MIEITLTGKAESYDQLKELFRAALQQVEEDSEFIHKVIDDNNRIEGDIIDSDSEKVEWEEKAGYKLSPNQVKFCVDAERKDHEINFDYSGRGMFGKKCPAVTIEDSTKLFTLTKTKMDSMGLSQVIYAEN